MADVPRGFDVMLVTRPFRRGQVKGQPIGADSSRKIRNRPDTKEKSVSNLGVIHLLNAKGGDWVEQARAAAINSTTEAAATVPGS
jgi:hypothetical protein